MFNRFGFNYNNIYSTQEEDIKTTPDHYETDVNRPIPPIYFECPYSEIRVEIGSDMADEVGVFTKFILEAVQKNYTPEKISSSIAIAISVVEEEIDYLCGIGFINKKENHEFALTEAGIRFHKLLETIENFNRNSQILMLNRYTSQVEIPFTQEHVPTENSLKLPARTKDIFLKNRNFENSKEIVLSHFHSFFENLTDQQIDSVYIQITSAIPGTSRYFYLDKHPSWKENQPQQIHERGSIYLKHPIDTITYRYTDNEYEKYKNLIDTLEKIMQFAPDLLSDKAACFLKKAAKIRSANDRNEKVYFDIITGFPVDEAFYLSEADIKGKNAIVAEVPLEIPDNDTESVMLDYDEVIRISEHSIEHSLYQPVFFDELIPYGKENDE